MFQYYYFEHAWALTVLQRTENVLLGDFRTIAGLRAKTQLVWFPNA